MRIAIIDDQETDVLHLKKCFRKFFLETEIQYEICVFSNAESFLSTYEAIYDFLVFDIDMPGLNGIDAAKKLREIDENVVLMFVTNMPQYALDGYSVDAIDYVLKPISYPEFCLKMRKAMRYIAQEQTPKVGIQTSAGYVCLDTSDIYYIESQLHYLIYHTKSGEYRARTTLNDAERKLAPYHFARSSVSYLVNLKYLETVSGDNIVVHGTPLRISRTKKNSFLSAFTKYMGGLNE